MTVSFVRSSILWSILSAEDLEKAARVLVIERKGLSLGKGLSLLGFPSALLFLILSELII